MSSMTRISNRLVTAMRNLSFASPSSVALASRRGATATATAAFTDPFQREWPGLLLQQQQQRYASSNSEKTLRDSYEEKKRALKAIRTQRYEEQQARKERVKRRRDGKPKNARKKQFETWFRTKKRSEEISDHKAKKLGMDWKINVAVVLERLPIVLPDKPQWEKDYDNLRTYLDQFGRSFPNELLGKNEIEELEDLTDEAMLEKHLPRGYTPAPRETEADASGDVRTLDRRLKTWVYLTVKDSDKWEFPTVQVREDETLLDAAKRALEEKVGGTLEIYYPSNCPMAVDMKVYSKEDQKQNIYGEKTFFMVVQYDDGKVDKSGIHVDDFAWLEKTEVVERIKEEQGEEKSKLYQYLLTT